MFSDLKIRTGLSRSADNTPQAIAGTPFGSAKVAQVEPTGMEMSRCGRRFWLGNNAAITGIAPSATHPTTAASWVIQNRSAEDSLVFEEIGAALEGGTPDVGGALIVCIAQTPAQTATAMHAGLGVYSCSAGTRASRVVVAPSITITQPPAPVWYTIASNPSPNVAIFPGSTNLAHRDVAGRIIVPPGSMLGLAVVAGAGTNPLFMPFAMWLEVPLTFE